MLEGRWVLALAAGLVLVLVSVAMVVGFQDEPPRGQRPPTRMAPPDTDEELEDPETETDAEESWPRTRKLNRPTGCVSCPAW